MSRRLQRDAGTWPVLRPLNYEAAERGVVLNRPVCVVGARSSRVHLPLANEFVSRAHALVVNDGDTVYVRDLASRNGLYRNGRPVREAALREADILAIGPIKFHCASGFDAPAARSADASGGEDGGDASAIPPGVPTPAVRVTGTGARLPLTSRTFLIGTRPGCDAALAGVGVSPVHAVIFRRGDEWFLRDLNSEGGTFLNGNLVREHTLQRGDNVRVGVAELRFEMEATEDSQTNVEDAEEDLVTAHSFADSEVSTASVEEPEESAVPYEGPLPITADDGDGHYDDEAPIAVVETVAVADVDPEPIPLAVAPAVPAIPQSGEPRPSSDEFDLAPEAPAPSLRDVDVMVDVERVWDPGDPPRDSNPDATPSVTAAAIAPGSPVFDADVDRNSPDGPPSATPGPTVTTSDHTDSDLDSGLRRDEEQKVIRLLNSLSRNVGRLKSSWRTLYGQHGRDAGNGDQRPSKRPD